MIDGLGPYSTTYDALNRPATASDPAGNVITYAYDPRGFRATMAAPGSGVFTYTYDADGRIQPGRVGCAHHLLNRSDGFVGCVAAGSESQWLPQLSEAAGDGSTPAGS